MRRDAHEPAPTGRDLIEKLLAGPRHRYQGVMGVFYYVDDAAAAVRALRRLGHQRLAVFSPVPHHEIEQALDQGPSLVRWVTFTGGVSLGCTGGFALCIYSVYAVPARGRRQGAGFAAAVRRDRLRDR